MSIPGIKRGQAQLLREKELSGTDGLNYEQRPGCTGGRVITILKSVLEQFRGVAIDLSRNGKQQ